MLDVNPGSMTVLCTYQCTAACRQCCFESSPQVAGRLQGAVIRERIAEAKREFSSLSLVAFSGGEPFLLRDELIDCVEYASSLGLRTRIVSNGSWAKRMARATSLCEALASAGLNELNLSTGADHQEFVPEASIVNAALAAVKSGIGTVVTVETDTEDSGCYASLVGDARIRELLKGALRVIKNYWVPFFSDALPRMGEFDPGAARVGCSQIFKNLVVTPHDNLSACCGITLEHIPEMRLGRLDGSNMKELHARQQDDFMKYWISVAGPYAIIESVMGEAASQYLGGVVHGCQACAILHRTPEIRAAIKRQYIERMEDVMTRFAMDRLLEERFEIARGKYGP